MNVATYTRVSTKKQSIDSQTKELAEVCSALGAVITARYTDVISGSKRDRPGLDKMLEDARSKPFDAVVIYKIDRMARSLVDFIDITQRLQDAGVALICPGQGINTSDQSPCGRLQRQLLASVAEFERSLTRERVQAGIDAAKERGVKFGKPSKKLVKNWPEIVNTWKEGVETYRELAERLGGVSVSTAYSLAHLAS